MSNSLTHHFRQDLPILTPDPPVASYPDLLMPQAIHARLSAHCNLDCAFCEREAWKAGDKDAEQDMSEAVWDRLVAEYLPHVHGAELVGLGEPTLAKLFPKACADVLRLGKVLYFATNGLFLDKRHVLDAVGDTPRVSISVDAGDAESYQRVRGGDWGRLVEAVTTFRKAKPNAFLHSQFTAGRYNIDHFPAFVQAASDWGINEVLFRWVQAHTVAREDVSLRWSRARTEAAIHAAEEIAQRTGISLIIERRSYSETDPDLDDGAPDTATEEVTGTFGAFSQVVAADPFARLKKYLDFMPMDDPTCPGGDGGSSGGGGGGGDSGGTHGTKTLFRPDTSVDGYTDDPERDMAFDLPQIEDIDVGGAQAFRIGSSPEHPTAAPNNESQPRAYAPAALIVAADGELWSCFARHVVGNAMTDTFEDVIHNPRYQAFLHGRQTKEGILQEQWCRHCPRTF